MNKTISDYIKSCEEDILYRLFDVNAEKSDADSDAIIYPFMNAKLRRKIKEISMKVQLQRMKDISKAIKGEKNKCW